MACPAPVTRFILNDTPVETGLAPGTTVLDYLRSVAGLTGTKEGCREGDCGACTVIIGSLDGTAVRYQVATSCLLAIGSVNGKHLVTIEGLSPAAALSPIQQAMVDEGASQCGFCTPGFIVSLTGGLLAAPALSEEAAIMAVEGNICRCTGYLSIKRAISRVCRLLADQATGADRLALLVDTGMVPAWFTTIAERLAALPQPRQATVPQPGQTILGGGTDLYVQRGHELTGAELFTVGSAGLDRIWRDGDDLYLGAGASTEAFRTSPLVQELLGDAVASLRLISSLPIRHMATIGGNLVNASPIGDLAIILLALDATVGLRRGAQQRELPLRRLFRGYKQLDLGDSELIEWIRMPGRLRGAAFAFEKVSKRTHLDIASVNCAMLLRLEHGTIHEAHVAAGGVAPIPLFLPATAAALTGGRADAATAHRAAAAAAGEISPISDMRGSAAYKRLLLQQLLLASCNRLLGLEEGAP